MILLVYILSCITTFITGILVYKKNPKSNINKNFLGFTLAVSFWVFTLILSDIPSNYTLFSNRIVVLPASFIPYYFVLLSYAFYELINKKFKITRKLQILLLFPILFILLFTFTDANVSEVIFRDWGTEVKVGWLYYIIFIYFLGYLSIAFKNLHNVFKVSTGIIKVQIKYVSIGSFLGLSFGIFTNIISFFIDLPYAYIFGPISGLIMIGFVAYAIVRYRFLDIRLVINKFIIYWIALISMYIIFYAILGLEQRIFGDIYDIRSYVLTGVIFIIITILFTPFKSIILRFVQNNFFSEVYLNQNILEDLTKRLTTIIKIDDIVNLIQNTLIQNFHLGQMEIILYNKDGKIISANPILEYKKYQFLRDKNFIAQMRRSKDLIIRSEIKLIVEQTENKEIQLIYKNIMRTPYEIYYPIIYGKELLGIFLIGEKDKKEVFTTQDLKLIKILGQQSAIAIKNALLYQEINDFNRTLNQKVKIQTQDILEKAKKLEKLIKMKDEFLTIASHQLRTPTTVIKGSLSMMVEDEFDKWTPEDKNKFISGMYEKSIKLSNIIDDILLSSEIDSVNFQLNRKEEFDIIGIIKEVKESYEDLAKKHDLKLIFNNLTKKEEILVIGNREYIKKAIQSLVDNALRYTKKGEIKINIDIINGKVLLEIKDTGIGILKTDRKNVMNKFTRGKNGEMVYIDGSGLGLYLTKRIVELHNGRFWFESEENVGSDFFVEL